MSKAKTHSYGHPLPEHQRQWLAKLARDMHPHHAADHVGINRSTFASAVAGFPVSAGTHSIIREAYARRESEAA